MVSRMSSPSAFSLVFSLICSSSLTLFSFGFIYSIVSSFFTWDISSFETFFSSSSTLLSSFISSVYVSPSLFSSFYWFCLLASSFWIFSRFTRSTKLLTAITRFTASRFSSVVILSWSSSDELISGSLGCDYQRWPWVSAAASPKLWKH